MFSEYEVVGGGARGRMMAQRSAWLPHFPVVGGLGSRFHSALFVCFAISESFVYSPVEMFLSVVFPKYSFKRH